MTSRSESDPVDIRLDPDPRWYGLVGCYGGYVAALCADASSDPGYRLRSLTLRFGAGVGVERMHLRREVLHRGRRSMTTRITLAQGGRDRAEATAVSLRAESAAPRIRREASPALEPPPDHRGRPHVQGDLAFARNLDLRTPPLGDVDQGTSAWIRLREPAEDLGLRSGAAVACVLLDALLPVLFAADDPPVFVPTVEFGYAFTPAADEIASGWCIGRNRLDWLQGETCAEDATLVDAGSGRLLARQRQLRTVRRGERPHPPTTPTRGGAS